MIIRLVLNNGWIHWVQKNPLINGFDIQQIFFIGYTTNKFYIYLMYLSIITILKNEINTKIYNKTSYIQKKLKYESSQNNQWLILYCLSG